MQVSQHDDHITHAVIGNQETIEMGVSDDAALMHILSSTLYTYPKLAVIREIICNGWDAHIAAGKTDTPLQITLADNQVTIRDFGFGIAHKDIGPIYGVYGNSTKRDDSKSTGGFGLGSKAPFAYTDNFEVASHHLGLKTIYRVSKSSMEKGGKPSINKIVAVPTQETGIAVTFGIDNRDVHEFSRMIREVVLLGEIKATLNDEQLSVLPLLESPSGYVLTSLNTTLAKEINVRYGNVVYPVPRHEAYSDLWDRIESDLDDLWQRAAIIFLAPADSLSIAPTREALILSDATVATIKALLETYDLRGNTKAAQAANQIYRTFLNKAVRNLSDEELMSKYRHESHLGIPEALEEVRFTYSVAEAFRKVALRKQGTAAGLCKRKILAELVRRKLIHVRMGKFILKLQPTTSIHRNRAIRSAASRYMDYPIKHALRALPAGMSVRTHIAHRYAFSVSWENSYREACANTGRSPRFIKDAQAIIVRTKKEMEAWVEKLPAGEQAWLVVLVGSSKQAEARAKAVEPLLTKLGYSVTVHLPELEKKVRTPSTTPKRKKRTGHYSLTHSFEADTRSFLLNTARAKATEDTLLESPIAWVVLNNKHEGSRHFGYFSSEACRAIHKLWGNQIAVVTSVQANKLLKQGVPPLQEFIAQFLDEKLATSSDFKRYLAFAYRLEGTHSNTANLVQNMVIHEDLMKSLGLRFHVTPETCLLLELARGVQGSWTHLPKCAALVKKVKPHPLLSKTLSTLEHSPWSDYISTHTLAYALGRHKPGTEKCQPVYEILRHMFNKG